jgi:hypothetical protein
MEMAETLVARMRRYSADDVEELLQAILGGDQQITEDERHSAIADALDLCLVVREFLLSEEPVGMATGEKVTIALEALKDGKIKLSSHSQEGERVLRKGEVAEVRWDGGKVKVVKRKQ